METLDKKSISYKAAFGTLITIVIMLLGSWATQIQARMDAVETQADGIYKLQADISSMSTDIKWIKEKLK